MAHAAPHLRRVLNRDGPEPGSVQAVALTAAINGLGPTLMAELESEHVIPPVAQIGSFFSFYDAGGLGAENTPQLQRKLTFEVERSARLQLSANASTAERARLASLSGAYSSAWLTVLPSESEMVMPNNSFELALRLRLGLAPPGALPHQCCCGVALATDHTTCLVLCCAAVQSQPVTTKSPR